MHQYLNMITHVMNNGLDKSDRTNTGTRSVFGYQCRFNLSDGFPAVTTKKLLFDNVKSELLWFLRGSVDERELCEILHGSRDLSYTTIWTNNAYAPNWVSKATFDGDCGRIYGAQMRSWIRPDGTTLDQLQELVDGIKKDPDSRRHIVVNYNPGEVDQMSLNPCHALFQFYVGDGKLSCQLYQRSADLFLGVTYNIASYALLTHMIAQVCDLQVGEFIHTFGDLHIYNNHMSHCITQLSRDPYELPTLWLNPDIKNIFDFTMDDIKLINYQHHPFIKAPMAV